MAADGPEAAESAEMTVDDVARAAGTTTRNVRNYQSRGLLSPPRMVGRTGYYGPEHLSRLRLIASLQTRGYSLAAIADLLQAWEKRRTVGEVLGLDHALAVPYADEPSEVIAIASLEAVLPEAARDDAVRARALALGLITPHGDDQVRVTSPRLLEVGQTLLQNGVPVEAALDELQTLREHAQAIASRFVALFTRHVWDPWVAAGQPLERLPELLDTIRSFKPLPTAAMNAVLAQALDREVERIVADHLTPGLTPDAASKA